MSSPFQHVSYSEIKLARKCPKAWYYRYVERLRRKKPNRPAFIGTILHEMLDVGVKSRRDPDFLDDPWKVLGRYQKEYKKLFREEKEEFGDVPATVEAIYEGYGRRWKGDGYRYSESEVEVRASLTPKIQLLGYIDKIVIDKNGRRFLMDHKFNRIIPGPDDRFADIQTVLYLWAWNASHPKAEWVEGVIWDYGRMKAPTMPEVLKRGGLSKRANIDTDVHTYRQAIRENGLAAKGYRDILKKLEGKERTFFERVPLPAPSKQLIQTVVDDARSTAGLRKSFAEYAPRNMSGFNCKTCDYRAVCEAEVRGLDAKFVRKRDYEIKEQEKDNGYIEEAA